MGRLLITQGGTCIALGATLRFAPWLISWFGKLTGDEKKFFALPETKETSTEASAKSRILELNVQIKLYNS